MRFVDSVTLATTKLRTHKLRTALTTGVSGILFGLLIAIIVIVQGVFDSAARFSEVGLGDRYIASMSIVGGGFYIGEHSDNPGVVERVASAHAELVSKKQAAAKKYNIEYDPKAEDPSPVILDTESGKRIIDSNFINSPIVRSVESQISQEKSKELDPDSFLENYSAVTKIGEHRQVMPNNGSLLYMKDGKEQSLNEHQKLTYEYMGSPGGDNDKALYTLPQTVAEPFVSTGYYDSSSGDLPVILPYGDAEKLLGLGPLLSSASPQDRRTRMQEVKDRVSEVKVSFCYRNQASIELLERAKSVDHEIDNNKNNKDYQKPSLIYAVPEEGSCGEVKVASDTRTEFQKRTDDNQKLFEQEAGIYVGEPEQYKLTLQAVGVSADVNTSHQHSTVSSVIHSLMASSLGYGAWNIPAGLLEQVPESSKPFGLFDKSENSRRGASFGSLTLLEFSDSNEARRMMKDLMHRQDVWVAPFGSASLVLEEVRGFFEAAMFWVVLAVGLVATIILSGLVGRTIADSRRETAVFRSIGASRGDIAGIYVVYTFLFSIRVAIFALVLGLILAGLAHIFWSEAATVGAELAFVAIGTGIQFGFIGFMSEYLPVVIGVIVVMGLVSVVVPLLRNVRRNPINDMRDE